MTELIEIFKYNQCMFIVLVCAIFAGCISIVEAVGNLLGKAIHGLPTIEECDCEKEESNEKM